MLALGEFEQLVLLAVLRAGDGAYGARILKEVRTAGRRRASRGAVYVTLGRLEEKGLLRAGWAKRDRSAAGGPAPLPARVRRGPAGAALVAGQAPAPVDGPRGRAGRGRGVKPGTPPRLADLLLALCLPEGPAAAPPAAISRGARGALRRRGLRASVPLVLARGHEPHVGVRAAAPARDGAAAPAAGSSPPAGEARRHDHAHPVEDLRVAARTLTRRPLFVALVVATLALGIGGNVALFSVVDGVLLRPLPYPDPDRLVIVWENDRLRGTDREGVSGPGLPRHDRDEPVLRGPRRASPARPDPRNPARSRCGSRAPGSVPASSRCSASVPSWAGPSCPRSERPGRRPRGGAHRVLSGASTSPPIPAWSAAA